MAVAALAARVVLPHTSVHPSLRTCCDGVLGLEEEKFVRVSATSDCTCVASSLAILID